MDGEVGVDVRDFGEHIHDDDGDDQFLAALARRLAPLPRSARPYHL